jgi:hypothetical protein
MSISRQTFVVQVHDDEGYVVVEDLRTRETARVTELAEICSQIARWMAAREEREEEARWPDDR